jgi:hypothetical protein
MAEVATDGLRLRSSEIGHPLEEMWVSGDLLGPDETLENGSVVLALDIPATELPWLAKHPAGAWVGDLPIVEPSADQLAEQLGEELAVSRGHLRAVLEGYWNPTWRRDNKGYDESPEDHLWRAATAVTDILDTLDG